MSSNNFYRVLKVGNRYAVEMGWMEEDTGLDPAPAEDAWWFDSLEEALEYAGSQYSEYGVFFSSGSPDSFDARE